MPSLGSVSAWIDQLRAGEDAALERLYQRFWPFLVQLARRRLEGMRRAADEEDVAQQAFWAFYQSLKAGRLPDLANRQELLALLTHITTCQAVNQIKHEVGVARRGKGRVRGESVFDLLTESGEQLPGLAGVEDTGLSPAAKAMAQDCYEHYVGALPDHLRPFAELQLAGLTHKEIAEKMGCTKRTVDRKMALVLAKWGRMADAQELSGEKL
jgi:DNA-directed RNA polymerase specialized sigma24 family protein